MVNFFIGELQVRRISIDDIPKLWRKKVQDKLAEMEAEKENVEETGE